MTTLIRPGTILIDDAPWLMQLLPLKSEPYSGKWSVLKGPDGFSVDREINDAGWHFFFLAAEVKAMFFGAIKARKVQDALKRILRKVRSQNFNCLEITGIEAKRFFGISYATVSAHSRHIQQSSQLDDLDRRGLARNRG